MLGVCVKYLKTCQYIDNIWYLFWPLNTILWKKSLKLSSTVAVYKLIRGLEQTTTATRTWYKTKINEHNNGSAGALQEIYSPPPPPPPQTRGLNDFMRLVSASLPANGWGSSGYYPLFQNSSSPRSSQFPTHPPSG